MRKEAREPWRSGEDKTEVLLSTLVQEALSSQEIADALRSTPGLTAESLASVAVRDRHVITRSAARAEHEYLHRRAEYRSSGWALLLSLPVAITSVLLLGDTVATVLTSSARWSSFVAVLAVAMAGLLLSVLIRWVSFGSERRIAMSNITAAMAWFVSLIGLVAMTATIDLWPALPVISLVVLLAVLAVAVPFLGWIFGLAPTWAALLSQSDRRRYQDAAVKAFAAWRRSLLVDGVEPALRAEITRHSTPTYAITVSLDPRSLDTFRPTRQAVWVETEAGRALATLLTREQGSFALRGPRGSGKTTLMAAQEQSDTSEERDPGLVIMVAAPVEYSPREFLIHLYATLCLRVLDYAAERGELHQRWRRLRRPQNSERVRPSGLASLAALAERRLDRLRYLQTSTNEVSGKLSATWGELAGKRTLARASQPLTYPEVVADLRAFLADCGRTARRVLICIDELDRITDREQAHRFLNEIKAIFDVPGCCFLVSVSEEALRAFELTGVGRRTVFDSAFDEVVRVEYLDFELARSLVLRRFLGLSEQYHALAYVLSGGLARELIRSTRYILESSVDEKLRLSEVTLKLAARELQEACESAKHALVEVPDHLSIAALMRAFDEYTQERYSDGALLAYVRRLNNITANQAAGLRDAVAALAYFLATLVAVFDDSLNQARIMRATQGRPGGRFDALARIRRYLGINPQAAVELLDDFRQNWGLSPLNS